MLQMVRINYLVASWCVGRWWVVWVSRRHRNFGTFICKHTPVPRTRSHATLFFDTCTTNDNISHLHNTKHDTFFANGQNSKYAHGKMALKRRDASLWLSSPRRAAERALSLRPLTTHMSLVFDWSMVM